jgi:hypothetical protein
MASTKSGGRMSKKLLLRRVGKIGAEFAKISVKTVRSVVKENIGVSLLQSILAGWGECRGRNSRCRTVGVSASLFGDHTNRHQANISI